MTTRFQVAGVLLALLIVQLPLGQGQEPLEQRFRETWLFDDQPNHRYSAPVFHQNQILVVSTNTEAMVVAFVKEIDRGVEYRFRHLAKDGTTTSGTGMVYERLKRLTTDDAERVTEEYDKDGLFVRAGSLRVEWSYGGKGRSWVYYLPDQAPQVGVASAKHFEQLQLKRFLRK